MIEGILLGIEKVIEGKLFLRSPPAFIIPGSLEMFILLKGFLEF